MREKENLLIQISETDNVAVATSEIKKNTTLLLNGEEITTLSDIPFGHKIAVRDIAVDENIVKYGYPIGHATSAIQRGEHIHTHNLKTNLSGIDEYTYIPEGKQSGEKKQEYFFDGYVRSDGQVGIRNEIWIVPTVGCVNKTAERLAKMANDAFSGQVDGVYAFTHNMGCSQLSEDMERTQKILSGLVHHPNAAGVLVLSLGCENNNLDVFRPVLGDVDEERIRFLVTQDVEDEYEAGMEILSELAENANKLSREKVSADKLVIGLKCGGSDGFSGITANPLIGNITDRIVEAGGSAILTEVPEMFGAERLLMNRAENEAVYEDIVTLINDFKNYFIRYDQTIYENPSPGNKKGGISSLEEKSLGCTQKSGSVPVSGVLQYGEPVKNKGLNLLTSPGNDQVSCTNLTASGAQLILFSTGRGNPFGAPAPTVKIASNERLAQKKANWIDFNAGKVLDGVAISDLGEELFAQILDIASGKKKTKSEENDYREISVFRDGVIL